MITHRRSAEHNWAVCGAVRLVYSDNPTCLNCVAGRWTDATSELVRVLTENSVKDIQEAEDRKAMEYVSTYTANSLTLSQAPTITTSNTITITGNALDASKVKP